MKSSKKLRGISTIHFAKLTSIFLNKSWEIDDGDNEYSSFNRFCTALSNLSDQEQALVLELTEKFTKIDANNYPDYLSQVLTEFINFNQKELKKIQKIYIAPLISPKDFGKSKSSTAVQYFIRGIVSTNPGIASKRIIFTNGLEVSESLINKDDAILLLVDDFVGSGATALEAIEYLNRTKNIDKSKISILTIAALEIGETNLKLNLIPVYYAMKFNRGISDCYCSQELLERVSLMESIETKLHVHEREKFGFDGSEALIKLIRTPNNTFPVFWKEKKGRIAPFPR